MCIRDRPQGVPQDREVLPGKRGAHRAPPDLHPGLPDRAAYPPPLQPGEGHRHDLLHRGRSLKDVTGILTSVTRCDIWPTRQSPAASEPTGSLGAPDLVPALVYPGSRPCWLPATMSRAALPAHPAAGRLPTRDGAGKAGRAGDGIGDLHVDTAGQAAEAKRQAEHPYHHRPAILPCNNYHGHIRRPATYASFGNPTGWARCWPTRTMRPSGSCTSIVAVGPSAVVVSRPSLRAAAETLSTVMWTVTDKASIGVSVACW